MSFTGTETIVAEVLALLKAGMAGKLTTFETEYADGVALPAPASSTGYWTHLADPRLLKTYPAIVIRRGPRTRIEGVAIGGEHAFSNEFAVEIVVRGADNADLTTKMDRYVRAVSELLCATDSLSVGQCLLERVGYEEPQGTDRKSGDFLQDVPLFFSVTTYEYPS